LDDKVEQTEIMSIESGSGVRIAYPSSWRVPQNRPCLKSLSGQSKDALEGEKRGGPLRSSTLSLHFDKSIAIDANDVDPNETDTAPQGLPAIVAANQRKDDGGGDPL
jgi:hypothetical protein